jgi:RNA polymerase sigma-70 factor, ECF subfamily
MTGRTPLGEGTLRASPPGLEGRDATRTHGSIPDAGDPPPLADRTSLPGHVESIATPLHVAMSDRELLDRLRAGDADAFDTVFRTWYPAVVRVAERIVREESLAEELAQEVFLGLWRRRESLDAEGTAQGYLFQAVRNRALNHLRHSAVERKAAVVLPFLAEPPAPADAGVEASDLEHAIATAIAGLPTRCREVFTMSRERGLRYAEIADVLGISVKAVEANMGRALKQLRAQLAPWLEEFRR